MVITSPPYWALRDYGVPGQIGLEPSFDLYVERLCDVFDEVRRVLKPEGTCWVNLGDTYWGGGQAQGHKKDTKNAGRVTGTSGYLKKPIAVGKGYSAKSLCLIPARFTIEMVKQGWILRNEIIWHKPNCIPSSVKDRFTVNFEKLFFFVKRQRYYFEQQFEPLAQNSNAAHRRRLRPGKEHNAKAPCRSNLPTAFDPRGRNRRSVWTIPARSCRQAHSAVFPPELVETPILAGCPEYGIVLDPFLGSGTTAIAALKLNRRFVGIELNPDFVAMAQERIAGHLKSATEAA